MYAWCFKMNLNSHSVIASAAKQSIYQPAGREMDCFAALAMTSMDRRTVIGGASLGPVGSQ
jgi:hypothetical protein